MIIRITLVVTAKVSNGVGQKVYFVVLFNPKTGTYFYQCISQIKCWISMPVWNILGDIVVSQSCLQNPSRKSPL